MLKTDDGYWLVATSNDAPDAFPLLHSTDLVHWEPRGFVFPQGQEPGWAATGRNVADFWAPEMAKVGDEYWTLLHRAAGEQCARYRPRAKHQPRPVRGSTTAQPLITGKPVDTIGLGYEPERAAAERRSDRFAHLRRSRTATQYLFWKDDTNSIWPRPLAMLLRAIPS